MTRKQVARLSGWILAVPSIKHFASRPDNSAAPGLLNTSLGITKKLWRNAPAVQVDAEATRQDSKTLTFPDTPFSYLFRALISQAVVILNLRSTFIRADCDAARRTGSARFLPFAGLASSPFPLNIIAMRLDKLGLV